VIIVLSSELFEGHDTDDVQLIGIFDRGRSRYKIRLKPAYRPGLSTSFETWLGQQSAHTQTQVRTVLEQGLTEWGFSIPDGEPRILVERRGSPEWPDSFAHGPVKLPLKMTAELLDRPLELLLENGRNDWGFLNKVVPFDWRTRWAEAVEAGWIAQQGGGLGEIKQVIREQIALHHARRLRTWVMFDSDGRVQGHLSTAATAARDACKEWTITHHPLQRRAIENYIPKAVLYDLATRRANDETIQETYKRNIRPCLDAYFNMGKPEQRHHYNLADGFNADAKSKEKLDESTRERLNALYDAPLKWPTSPLYGGLGGNPAQEIWGNNPDRQRYEMTEEHIRSADFEDERAQIFQSIFAML
jgi:hypothetical protein